MVGCAQTVYGLSALALAVPVFFHWYEPREDEDEGSNDWASTSPPWQLKLQLIAFCSFEVTGPWPLCKQHCP
jgi:hypothetical protein